MSHVKIMLVDDEERFLATTKKLFAKKGHDVFTAGSGGEALDMLEKHIVDVVILDVKMPGMDGITTLGEIKKLYPLTEVIMLTGHATVDSAVDGLKSGAFDYVMKPCEIDELLEKVNDAYEKVRKMEEKIRLAQAKAYMKSPREILKQSSGDE